MFHTSPNLQAQLEEMKQSLAAREEELTKTIAVYHSLAKE